MKQGKSNPRMPRARRSQKQAVAVESTPGRDSPSGILRHDIGQNMLIQVEVLQKSAGKELSEPIRRY